MSVEMADQTLAAVLDQITYCSIKRSHAELIACAIHVPLCVNGQRVPPCNEDCLGEYSQQNEQNCLQYV